MFEYVIPKDTTEVTLSIKCDGKRYAAAYVITTNLDRKCYYNFYYNLNDKFTFKDYQECILDKIIDKVKTDKVHFILNAYHKNFDFSKYDKEITHGTSFNPLDLAQCMVDDYAEYLLGHQHYNPCYNQAISDNEKTDKFEEIPGLVIKEKKKS